MLKKTKSFFYSCLTFPLIADRIQKTGGHVTENNIRENKMGVMPVNRLLLTMSVPMMVSMLVQALYNIVDSMFVAMLSENALTAVSFAFPAQTLMIAVATGTGVGINALLSKSLGEKKFERADKTAANAVFLAVCASAVFAVAGFFLSRPFFEFQTDVPDIIDGGTAYLQICTVFSFGMMFQITAERLLQSTGKTFFTMITQMTGAVINIVLDPVLIFGLIGFPKMGVAGAAAATVIGQFAAAVLAVVFNRTHNKEIHVTVRGFRPDGYIIGRIYLVGVPSIILAAIGSVMTFGMNKILITFSTTAVAVFGVYFKLQSFIFLPVFGLNNGMVPILAYNYGAGKPERILKTVKLSMLYAMVLMAVGVLVFQIFPVPLLKIFNASDNMIAIGVPALRIISVHFLLAGFSIVSISVLQAFSHGFLSLSVSLIRQMAVILPVAYGLSLTGNINSIWWCFPIAETVAVLMCAFYVFRVYRKEIRPSVSVR